MSEPVDLEALERDQHCAHRPSWGGLCWACSFALIQRVRAQQAEMARLQDAAAQSCSCQHDGRGNLTSECQTHEDIRLERDGLQAEIARLTERVLDLERLHPVPGSPEYQAREAEIAKGLKGEG